MKRTLYDILELSPQASDEAIIASYHRLIEKYDPDLPQNAGNHEHLMHYRLIKEAFATLSDPETRRAYDQSMQGVSQVLWQDGSESTGLFTWRKIFFLSLVLMMSGGMYVQYAKSQDEARLERERIAAEKYQAELAARREEEELRAQRERELQAARERAEFEQFRREVDRIQRENEAAAERARRQAKLEEQERERKQIEAEREAQRRYRMEQAERERKLRELSSRR